MKTTVPASANKSKILSAACKHDWERSAVSHNESFYNPVFLCSRCQLHRTMSAIPELGDEYLDLQNAQYESERRAGLQRIAEILGLNISFE